MLVPRAARPSRPLPILIPTVATLVFSACIFGAALMIGAR